MERTPPVLVTHLFPKLEQNLIQLLHSLSPREWEAQTIASKWKVKDVAAHLLDGNIRALSLQRDRYFGNTPPSTSSYADLVNWLNELNREWVDAAKRISPQVMILLHEATGSQVCDYFASLDLFEKAIFPVSWAGEEESLNWMHLAREYTEKWLHQQQIRDAVQKPGIMTKEFFFPFIRTFCFGLPHTYRKVLRPEGTLFRLEILSEAGGKFDLERRPSGWELVSGTQKTPYAELQMDADLAWKLFSKSLRPQDALSRVTIKGDRDLASVALQMVSVMA